MSLLKIIILAVIQGLAELLPVSSSAHVIVAEKLMGLDPTSPEMTFLLVMLHTGTMLAVIAYFWKAWSRTFFASRPIFVKQAKLLVIASVLTAIVGLPLYLGLPHLAGKKEAEELFGNLPLIATALAVAGVLILVAGLSKKSRQEREVTAPSAAWMGAVQGLCIPFRGFSRSGATISTGMLLGGLKQRVEEFSFALAVILTPAAVAMEGRRLLHHGAQAGGPKVDYGALFLPGMAGFVFSFVAGLVALKLLSRVLEIGRWYLFGVYCLIAAGVVLAFYFGGY